MLHNATVQIFIRYLTLNFTLKDKVKFWKEFFAICKINMTTFLLLSVSIKFHAFSLSNGFWGKLGKHQELSISSLLLKSNAISACHKDAE